MSLRLTPHTCHGIPPPTLHLHGSDHLPIGPSFSVYYPEPCIFVISQPCSVYGLPEENGKEVEDGLASACASPECDRPWQAAHTDSPFLF